MTEYVLAIHPATDGFGSHDPSAVLFVDGTVAFGVEEARLVRRKHAHATFPTRAIEACLDYRDIALSDIRTVLVPWERPIGGPTRGDVEPTSPEPTGRRRRRSSGTGTERIEARLAPLGGPVPAVETYNHHRCHAASAYLPSGFDDALVVTIDGRGGRYSTAVWSVHGDSLRQVAGYEPPNSLGYLYAAVTQYLGFRPFGGEGKVMGLAPHGSADPDIESGLRSLVDAGVGYDVTGVVGGGVQAGVSRLEDLFDYRPATPPGASDAWETNLAHATQQFLEEAVLAICETYCEQLGHEAVCLAGGVALNCKLNKRIAESPVVDRLFVQPVAGDAGAPIGAGLLASENPAVPETLYWGPAFSPAAARRLLEAREVPYRRPADLPRAVATLLADGMVVGWFQGRLEMGPRALGNRSVLADPRSAESRDRVNAFVKHREAWRPFAPSVLAAAADEYLQDPRTAPYMIRAFDTRPERRGDIPATLHPADDTVRPQTVRADDNPRFHRLLAAFADLTGVPALLNTSFNDRGEPIVATPADALETFFQTDLDALVLEEFLVERSEVSR